MKQLTFSPAAQQRVLKYLKPTKKMILDFDDGVGPFSAIGNCDMVANYRLLFVDQGMATPDFDERVRSNLGDIFIKSELYANAQFEPRMTVRFDPAHCALPLVSPLKILTPNLELVTIDNSYQSATYSRTRDC